MAKETHEPYQWHGEEVRDCGPVDKNYDPIKAQKQREAGRIPAPEVPPVPPKPPYKTRRK